MEARHATRGSLSLSNSVFFELRSNSTCRARSKSSALNAAPLREDQITRYATKKLPAARYNAHRKLLEDRGLCWGLEAPRLTPEAALPQSSEFVSSSLGDSEPSPAPSVVFERFRLEKLKLEKLKFEKFSSERFFFRFSNHSLEKFESLNMSS